VKKILKKIYDLIPFKEVLFRTLKIFWVPPEFVYRHLHFKGKMKIKIDEEHSFKVYHYGYALENEMYWSGVDKNWEQISIQLWIKLCRNADVIFDVGANTGIYSLIAQGLRPHAQVFAFEPVDRIFDKLENNKQMNNFNIKTEKLALSNNDGTAVIYDPMTEHLYSVTVNKNQTPENKNVRETVIATRKLSTYIKENNLNKIDLMKIDVETHEPEVLEGMGEFLNKFRPAMIIEIVHDDLAVRIEKIIEGMGYLYFTIDDKTQPKQLAKLTRSEHYNFLLCNEITAKELGLI
jgi:FkbM family methyltransferase